MGISCACELDDPDWYYEVHDQPCTLDTRRSRKCVSCRVRIAVGDTASRIIRYRLSRIGNMEPNRSRRNGATPESA